MFQNSNFAAEFPASGQQEATPSETPTSVHVSNPVDSDGGSLLSGALEWRLSGGGPGPAANKKWGSVASLSVDEDDDDEDEGDASTWAGRVRRYLVWLKIGALLAVWCFFTVLLMITVEEEPRLKLMMVPPQAPKEFAVPVRPMKGLLGVDLHGPFPNKEYEKDGEELVEAHLAVYVVRTWYAADGAAVSSRQVSAVWTLELADLEDLEEADLVVKHHTFRLEPEARPAAAQTGRAELFLHLESSKDSVKKELSLQAAFDPSPIDKEQAVVYAALVLVGLYVLIIWEIVDRTFAAILASTLSIAILGALHSRPSMETIIGWIDEETLLLLFGMMILVAILAETGVFDYLAVYAYKLTKGHVWPLLSCLCLFTAVFSSFLDNVTMVLLMTPVTIRLCEVMSLNAVPVLICIVIYSNVGGAMTPVGDPPNVIIASNEFVVEDGVDFGVFVAHMGPAVLLVMLQTFLQIRLTLRYFVDLELGNPREQQMRQSLQAWQRAAGGLTAFSAEEERVRNKMLAKVRAMKRRLRRAVHSVAKPAPNYQQTLEELERKYPIRNKPLLAKCACAVAFVIALFFLHTLPPIRGVSLGWSALLGAILLLILADMESMELVLGHVEWATLLFFAALFILMEALSHMGLIEWIGSVTVKVILSVDPEWQLAVSILIILWITAITSSFVDNIPVTTMMVKVVVSLSQNDRLDLPLQPLVWALALGACLGGNGTLIGASANVVCAGVAEQHGYKFTFTEFFKIGFPIMLMHIVVSTVYLMVCHLVFSWH